MANPMRIYFVRHGQSTNNALWASTGYAERRVVDPELTEQGRQQAALAADRFARHGTHLPANDSPLDGDNYNSLTLTHLYTSLMVRAVATGSFISEKTGIPLTARIDLHECGGIFAEDAQTGEVKGLPGKNRSYFESNYPDLILPESLDNAGWWNRPFETGKQRPARARRVLRALLREHRRTDHGLGVITHGGLYSHMLCVLFEIPTESNLWFSLNNAGITRVDVHPEHVNLVYHNRVDFLPSHLIT